MAEFSTPRFQMVGTRSAILEGPIAESIELQIEAIENALESVPDFAFDLSKTLVESVCKTVLADIGQPANPKWNTPKLVRETTSHLNLFSHDHLIPEKAKESVVKTVGGMGQTIHGLCELRNHYGMASHGRDALSVRLDLRQATLAAQAADTIVSFLYRIHSDARRQTPGARVHYEDHSDFNEEFDRIHEPVRLGGVELVPSQVLFSGDSEAYKAALNDFITERDGEGDSEGLVAQDGKWEEEVN